MAAGAQGYEVKIDIRALLTTKLLVVDLQDLSGTADLASPVVSLHDLLTKLFVQLRSESQPRILGSNLVHDPFSRA
jgi:hypothetical protein